MTLKKGSKGADVEKLQQHLKSTGLYTGQIDGIFGPLTEAAVKAYQKANALQTDGIVGPLTWTALQSESTGIKQADKSAETSGISIKKSRRQINEIILHCSATPEGRHVTTADIKRAHLNRGFSDIGYHYVVYLDGSVHKGRDVNLSGAHCTGHNAHSIGVCYIGGVDKNMKPKDTRTSAQKTSLVKLVSKLLQTYSLPTSRVYDTINSLTKHAPVSKSNHSEKSCNTKFLKFLKFLIIFQKPC